MYGYKAGIDLKTMVKSLQPGGGGSYSLNVLAPRILERNFDPGFYVEHFVKDLGIVLHESERMGIKMPGTELSTNMYKIMMEQGGSKLGMHGLMTVLEKMYGFELDKYKWEK